MNSNFNFTDGDILQFGGVVLVAERDSTKDVRDNAATVLSEDLTAAGTTITVETAKGMVTGEGKLGNAATESVTISGVNVTTGTLTVTRAAGSTAKTAGEIIQVVGAAGYSKFIPFGYIEKMAIDPGLKSGTVMYDFNGRARATKKETAEPTFTITGLQSGIIQRALAMGRDTASATVANLTRMSTTALENLAFLIVTIEQSIDGTGYKYGLIRLPYAKLIGSAPITFDTEAKKLEYTFQLLHDTTVNDWIVYDMEASE